MSVPKPLSPGEEAMALHLKAHNIPFEREVKFYPLRNWKVDFLLRDNSIIIEVEGGVWQQGRHSRGKGFESDCEKYNRATIMGYQVLRYSTAQVESGMAIGDVLEMILP
jgi:very-short-patch-repair endonuclease